MLTLQSNKEIRINKGDSGMAPLFINIGDNLRPIGYEFNIPLEVQSTGSDYKLYEDAFREAIIAPGTYEFKYTNSQWSLNDEEIDDISVYGFSFPEDEELINPTIITVTYSLIDNLSEVRFQLWPVLQDPDIPLLDKIIKPYNNEVDTYLKEVLINQETTNCVDSYGRILLKFNPVDTQNIERGHYLYQIRAKLYNKYSGQYDIKTITNRTSFYVIDDIFSSRIW